jgi:hypothetical protein
MSIQVTIKKRVLVCLVQYSMLKNFKGPSNYSESLSYFLISRETCPNQLTNMSHKSPNFRAVIRLILNEKKSKATNPSTIVCMSVAPSYKINMKF